MSFKITENNTLRKYEKINRILALWNPIGVPSCIADDEYNGYIPSIVKSATDKQRLMTCLEEMIVEKMELPYDPENIEHLNDLQNVCNEIYQICTAGTGQ